MTTTDETTPEAGDASATDDDEAFDTLLDAIRANRPLVAARDPAGVLAGTTYIEASLHGGPPGDDGDDHELEFRGYARVRLDRDTIRPTTVKLGTARDARGREYTRRARRLMTIDFPACGATTDGTRHHHGTATHFALWSEGGVMVMSGTYGPVAIVAGVTARVHVDDELDPDPCELLVFDVERLASAVRLVLDHPRFRVPFGEVFDPLRDLVAAARSLPGVYDTAAHHFDLMTEDLLELKIAAMRDALAAVLDHPLTDPAPALRLLRHAYALAGYDDTVLAELVVLDGFLTLARETHRVTAVMSEGEYNGMMMCGALHRDEHAYRGNPDGAPELDEEYEVACAVLRRYAPDVVPPAKPPRRPLSIDSCDDERAQRYLAEWVADWDTPPKLYEATIDLDELGTLRATGATVFEARRALRRRLSEFTVSSIALVRDALGDDQGAAPNARDDAGPIGPQGRALDLDAWRQLYDSTSAPDDGESDA